MYTKVDGAAFREMIIDAAYAVEEKKQELNDLNVFPVPDGDTGINMSMTINAAAAELRSREGLTLSAAADAVAMAMLRGARGNSGVILSLLFRGFSKQLRGLTEADAMTMAEALRKGVDAAYKAVMKPTEGTILTVSREAAEAAIEAAAATGDLSSTLECAAEAAHKSLAATTDLNPVLKKAGVVDAGGAGFVIILDVMNAYIRGDEIKLPEFSTEPQPKAEAEASPSQNPFDAFDTEDIHFTYCTEFIIDRAGEGEPQALRAYLESIGDCVVVVDDEEIIKVHVHSNNPGKAIEKALEFGSLDKIKIENMKLQHTSKVVEEREAQKPAPVEAPEPEPVKEPLKPYAFVSVAAGDGLHRIFAELGADIVVDGGQTMNPSTEDIYEAVEAAGSDLVYVLPNNKNIIMAALQVQPLTSKQVMVVQTRTVAEGISAMLTFDPEADPETNVAAMQATASGVATGEITYAARSSSYDDRKIREGDYLALLGGKLVDSSRRQQDVLKQLAKEMSKNPDVSFINVIYGEGVSAEEADGVVKLFSKALPDAEIQSVYGGQPVYYYIISAE